ncbi:MAG: zinc-dependent alcohol dehydrogenase family protein [Clostridia bacterium]|nr:zinc-dependent alcohol dehydrogenase family protein [Clostridia bacterium]
MKAIILHGKENISLGEFPTPETHRGEVKVAVSYCGICGSDYHKYEGKANTHPIRYPVPLGHEISGTVAEVGEDVKGLSVGDKVTVDPNWSCGKCYFCQNGKPAFCENARGVVKGMAEFVVSPVENVYKLPDGLSMRDAALAEPLSCCIHGADLLDARHGESVALVGFGAIGAMMLELLRLSGAGDITVIETNTDKKETAIEMGATRFVSPTDEEAIKELSESGRITKVIECVGNRHAEATAIKVAGKGATVVLFGVADEKEILPFSPYEAFAKELTVKASFVNPFTTKRAVDMLASGLLDTDRLISAVLSMEEAMDEIRHPNFSRKGKVLVKISDAE